MGIYQRWILPPLLNASMRMKALRPYRERIVGAADGRVLEIGIGSGLNLPLYGANVTSVLGIEPSPELLHMARRQSVRVPIELLEGTAEALPLDDASIDTVVTTWTLCTIADPDKALREARRVLRPGGSLLFVRARPRPGTGRRALAGPAGPVLATHDRRLPSQPRDRRVDRGRRLSIRSAAELQGAGPRTHTFLYEGRARPT